MAKGGKSYNDRIKSAQVRDKVLDAILLVYSGQEDKLTEKQWQLTLRMGTTVLPRLNEHTGEDGKELVIKITGESAMKYGGLTTHRKPSKDSN